MKKKSNITLLHGWGFDSQIWQQVHSHLATYYHVSMLDLPGYGQSPFVPEAWKQGTWIDEYASTLPNGSILCGWSLGGLIAMQIAAKYPEKVRQLVTVSATPKFRASNDWPIGMPSSMCIDMQRHIKEEPEKCLKEFQGWVSKGDDNMKGVLKSLRKLVPNVASKGHLKTLVLSLHYLFHTDMRDQVTNIESTWIAVQGNNDVLVSPESLRQYKNVTLIRIAGCGHAPMISHASCLLKPLIELSTKELVYEY